MQVKATQAIFCENAQRDIKTGKWSYTDVFEQVRGVQFPAKISFFLVVWLENVNQDNHCDFTIVLRNKAGDICGTKREHPVTLYNKTGKEQLVFQLSNIPFQSAADCYFIEILHCNQLILSKQLQCTTIDLRDHITVPSSGGGAKILYVGSKYDYGQPACGHSFEHHNFYHTLINMGYQVYYFDFLTLFQQYGKDIMNQMLVEAARRIRPDLAFFVLFENEFYPEAIQQLGCPTFNWFCDDHWRYDNYSSKWARFFTCVSTTAKSAMQKYHRDGIKNVIFTQWACNHFLYRPDCDEVPLDVSFVGMRHGNRSQIMGLLAQQDIKVDCWGRGWENDRVSQERMIKIFSTSKINLNLTNSSVGNIGQIKGRNFEVPGCGGFLLTGNAENLGDYYEIGKEIVCFDNVFDMIDKIKFYLHNDRARTEIARAGYERTIREHTYEKRFRDIFNKIGFE